jgi:hypothetical protein
MFVEMESNKELKESRCPSETLSNCGIFCFAHFREAFVEYTAVIDAAVGLHLTGTYFIDRAIKVEPVTGFPNEEQHEPITNNPEAAKVCFAHAPVRGKTAGRTGRRSP